MLAIAAAARLAGFQGPTATAEFGARFSQRQLAAARAFRSPATGGPQAALPEASAQGAGTLAASVLPFNIGDSNSR